MPDVVSRRTHRGFTLIELLVVVAIIALLISILLPSLNCARDQAKAAKCGVQMKGFGIGLTSYAVENNDWIPGVNTSGVSVAVYRTAKDGYVSNPNLPVQNYDWMTPLLRYDTPDLGQSRAARFVTALNDYRCPSMQEPSVLYRKNSLPDVPDWERLPEALNGVSYLMPVYFQLWGFRPGQARPTLATMVGSIQLPVQAVGIPEYWDVQHDSYRSKISDVGLAARKVAVADGTRYLETNNPNNALTNGLDYDANPWAGSFGSFTSAGAWRGAGTAYGVGKPSSNWDGQQLGGTQNASNGLNLWYSYRHGCNRSPLNNTAQSNKGSINALHFDGHVARYDDRQSREIHLWYPKGARVEQTSEGMTSVPQGFIVP